MVLKLLFREQDLKLANFIIVKSEKYIDVRSYLKRIPAETCMRKQEFQQTTGGLRVIH